MPAVSAWMVTLHLGLRSHANPYLPLVQWRRGSFNASDTGAGLRSSRFHDMMAVRAWQIPRIRGNSGVAGWPADLARHTTRLVALLFERRPNLICPDLSGTSFRSADRLRSPRLIAILPSAGGHARSRLQRRVMAVAPQED